MLRRRSSSDASVAPYKAEAPPHRYNSFHGYSSVRAEVEAAVRSEPCRRDYRSESCISDVDFKQLMAEYDFDNQIDALGNGVDDVDIDMSHDESLICEGGEWRIYEGAVTYLI